LIRSEAASLRYVDHGREVVACDAVSLEVQKGEFLGILGPSGSGKSSLLYLLSGLKSPTSGRVLVNDQDMGQMTDAERAKLRLSTFGFVFQQPFLLGYLSAIENALVGSSQRELDRAIPLFADLGLGEKMLRRPHELSGGEKQRVCVARAILGSPDVIFADEPTAALDHANGLAVVQLLNKHRGEGSLVMVTHDPTMLEAADRVLHLAEGRVERVETR
jgi:putative ABC transport system ATP-binding protein